MRQDPLPFYNERKTPVDMLLLHCSARNTENMLKILRQQELSCHYIIDTDGTVTSVVDESKRAWHGGLGSWGNILSDINSHSVGIELCHPDLGQSPYPQKQIEALTELALDIVRRHNIPPYNIVGHSDTAPSRKADPGKCFPWRRLAQSGLGVWYDTEADDIEKSIGEMLAEIGYDITDTCAAQYAFCRHFLPEAVVTDTDVMHLVDNILPPNVNVESHPKFKQVLCAVWRSYAAERLKG